MPDILDRDGNVIHTSKNLAGIRRYLCERYAPAIQVLSVSRVGQGEGKLQILFANQCSFETNFASFSVLCDFVRRWRNVHGAPLLVNGRTAGKVSKDNVFLREGSGGN